jgi:hypothetical protein
MSRGFPHTEVPVESLTHWATRPDNIRSAVLNLAGIESDGVKNVNSGEHIPADPRIAGYWSEGFRSCAALILRDPDTGGVSFTHCWARDEATLRTMRRAPRAPSEAVLVYGSQTEPQYDIELFLGAKGLVYNTIHVETGTEPFSVLVDNTIGKIAVARVTPDYSVLQYQALNRGLAS